MEIRGWNIIGDNMFVKKVAPLVLVLFLSASAGFSQSTLRPDQPPIPVDEIIRRFAEKEKEFKLARAAYTYRQDVKVQELDANDRVTGEFNQVSDIIFDSSGKRTERDRKSTRLNSSHI